jgi:hypothetical protein
MADKTLSILLKLRDDASAGMKKVNEQLQRQQKEAEKTKKVWEGMQKIGLAMGTAIVGALTGCVVAAEKDRQSQAKLKNAIENTGASYDDLQDSLESVIAATSRKTGITDEQQRESMSQLLAITGDYETSLKALPVALDLAAFKGIDTASAATILGRALNGNTMQLQRMGIAIDENASQQEILQAVMDRTGGAAEDMASPFAIMKNEMDEVAESLGYLLLPALRVFTNVITPIVGVLRNIIDNSGAFGKILVTVAAVVGVAALGLAAYAAAQNSALISTMGTTAELILNTAAHAAGTVALAAKTAVTIASNAATALYTAAMGAATAANSAFAVSVIAALGPVGLLVTVIGAGLAVVGGIGYGIYKLATNTNSLGNAAQSTNPLVAELGEAINALAERVAKGNQAIEDAKGKLEELNAAEEHVNANMEDAFGTHHLEAVKALETQIGVLEGAMNTCKEAIDAANRELEKLTSPRLEGMQDMEDDLFNVGQMIDLLNLKKLKMSVGADTTEVDNKIDALKTQIDVPIRFDTMSIDNQLSSLGTMQETLELEYSTTFDPLIRNAEEAVQSIQGLNTEMAPADVMTRITTLGETIKQAETDYATLAGQRDTLLGQLEIHQKAYQDNLDAINAAQLEESNKIYDTTLAVQGWNTSLETTKGYMQDILHVTGETNSAITDVTSDTVTLNSGINQATFDGEALWRQLNSDVTEANNATSAVNGLSSAVNSASSNANGFFSSFKSRVNSSLNNWRTMMATISSGGNVPQAAEGGIVTRPTYLLAGEAGPEAIIPLDKMGQGSTYNITISAGAFVGSKAEADSFANMILGSLRTKQRYAYGAAQF